MYSVHAPSRITRLGALLLVLLLSACAQDPSSMASAQEPEGLILRARGQKPTWSLEITETTLQWQGPELEFTGTLRILPSASGTRYGSTSGGHVIEVWSKAHVCRDGTSGMPHPYEIQVRLDERRHLGCGGDPATLLQGEWQVIDIAGGRLPSDAQATLEFDRYGRLSGRTACNRYSSRYTVNSDTLQMGPGATTRMACAPALMEVENRFLREIEAVRGFDLDAQGLLELRNANGLRIKARKL